MSKTVLSRFVAILSLLPSRFPSARKPAIHCERHCQDAFGSQSETKLRRKVPLVNTTPQQLHSILPQHAAPKQWRNTGNCVKDVNPPIGSGVPLRFMFPSRCSFFALHAFPRLPSPHFFSRVPAVAYCRSQIECPGFLRASPGLFLSFLNTLVSYTELEMTQQPSLSTRVTYVFIVKLLFSPG